MTKLTDSQKVKAFVVAFVLIDLLCIGLVLRLLATSQSPAETVVNSEATVSPLTALKQSVSSQSPDPTPQLNIKQPSESVVLPGATWVPQTFNNCGPATTAMALQYFGYNVSQEETKAKLRTNADDKNVFTYEIGEYLRNDYGIESRLLYGGDVQRLKTLLANDVYILIEDWLHPNEDIGHDTLIRGYDDSRGVFIFDDSYLGVNVEIPYQLFEQTQWKPFNRQYMPLYLPDKEPVVRAIVGDDWDRSRMYQNTVAIAQREIAENQNDMYAWFNLGTSQYELGNYVAAKEAFAKSQALGWPGRMLWYQIQPVKTLNALGDYSAALTMADLGLRNNDTFAELHYEKAVAYQGLGQLDLAKREVQRTIELAPNYQPAQTLLQSL